MFFSSSRGALRAAQDEAQHIFNANGLHPRVLSTDNLSTFGSNLGYAFRLVWEEKEILVFALLQWVVIAIAYVMWTRIFDWVPDVFWEETRRALDEDRRIPCGGTDLIMFAWSLFVIVVASYPLSVFNASIVSAHYLRNTHRDSTVFACIGMASRNLGKLWVYTAIDAWITVDAILDRFPKKRRRRTVFDELLYYAWKIGTIGVLPALAAGKNFGEAVHDSIEMLKSDPRRAIGVRMGYSLICWVIGIAAFIGGIYWLALLSEAKVMVDGKYSFYLLLAVPIVVAVGVTVVLIRPFYLIMISQLYTDIVPIDPATLITNRKFNWLFLFFLMLLGTLIAMYFYGDELGIRAWIEQVTANQLEQYHRRTAM